MITNGKLHRGHALLALLSVTGMVAVPNAAAQSISACYVPSTGNVYRVGAPNTLASCRAGHPAFTFGSGFTLPYSAQVAAAGALLSLTNTGTGPVLNAFSAAANHTAFVRNTGTGSGIAAYSNGWTSVNAQNQGSGIAVYGENATASATALFKNTSGGIAGSFEGRVNIVLSNTVTANLSPLKAQGASAGPSGYFIANGTGTAIKAQSDGTGFTAIDATTGPGGRHALYAVSNASSYPTIAVENHAGGRAADFVGGVFVNGSFQVTGSKNAVVATSSGARLLHAEESSEVWFTDHGFGKLKDGHAWIAIDPTYAETVSLDRPYHVFIEEYGDAEVYVSKRTPTGFEVTLSHGDHSVEFSYRLMAKRRGFEDRRLDRAPQVDGLVK